MAGVVGGCTCCRNGRGNVSGMQVVGGIASAFIAHRKRSHIAVMQINLL